MTYFRKRIRKEKFEKILAVSIKLHGEKAQEKDIQVYTTVQEKNITFPTDDKLYLKIIERTLDLAQENNIQLRRSYQKEIKEKKLALRFRSHPCNKKKAAKAAKRLKTIAGILLRELRRKLSVDILQYEQNNFNLYFRVLKQKRHDKNKIYSLHESHIYCMSKGELHKQYEFATKISIAKTTDSNIIAGALAFERNYYDGHTLVDVLSQVNKLSDLIPSSLWVDRGYRGQKMINDTRIFLPKPASKNTSKKFIDFLEKKFRKRAGIEGIISHLKSDYRLGRNYLKGFIGNQINVVMAAAVFNFAKWMRAILFWLYFWFSMIGSKIACQV